jgi:hypothetical protein
MSQQARDWLVSHPNMIFRHDTQRADLRSPGVTKTDHRKAPIARVLVGTACRIKSSWLAGNDKRLSRSATERIERRGTR